MLLRWLSWLLSSWSPVKLVVSVLGCDSVVEVKVELRCKSYRRCSDLSVACHLRRAYVPRAWWPPIAFAPNLAVIIHAVCQPIHRRLKSIIASPICGRLSGLRVVFVFFHLMFAGEAALHWHVFALVQKPTRLINPMETIHKMKSWTAAQWEHAWLKLGSS